MEIWTIKHTKNPWYVSKAFVKKESADDWAERCNQGARDHGLSIKYFVEPLQVIEE